MYSRAQRRDDQDRMRQRMIRYIKTWFHGGLADMSEKLTSDPEFVGRMTNNHGTHDCFMCKAEKYLGKPKVRRVSTRIFDI